MGQWYAINLGDPLWAETRLTEIKRHYAELFPPDSGLPAPDIYWRHESEGRVQCELVLYLSPASEDLARLIGAKSCPAPEGNDLSLLSATVLPGA